MLMTPAEFIEGIGSGIEHHLHRLASMAGKHWEAASDSLATRRLRQRLLAARNLLKANDPPSPRGKPAHNSRARQSSAAKTLG